MRMRQKTCLVLKIRRKFCEWKPKDELKLCILTPWTKLLALCPGFLPRSQVITIKEALQLEFIKTRV